MPTFAYRAIDASGTRRKGEVIAANDVAALDQIAKLGLTPIGIVEGTINAPWWARDIQLFGPRTLKPKELEGFFSSLAAMLNAKTPLPTALRFCADLSTDRAMIAKLQSAIASVEDGMSLANALTDDQNTFPDRLLTMIRLGEASNSLADVVTRAAQTLELESQLRREVRQAMIYPIILLLMSLLVMALLVFYLAPTLAPVFATANSKPPLIIATMIRVQQGVINHWPTVLIGAGVGAAIIVFSWGSIKKLWQKLLLVMPVTKRYLSRRETLRLCQTLYLMLSSGGQLSDAIKMSAETVSQSNWRDMLSTAHDRIKAGQSMTQAMLDNGLIDPMARTILKTGEQSDQLIAVLGPAITTLQSQTTQSLSQAVKLLTPLMTLLIGTAVGAIILSTVSAIMELNNVVF